MTEPKMLKAIHPYQRKIITPKEFIAEFGMNYKKREFFQNAYIVEKMFLPMEQVL